MALWPSKGRHGLARLGLQIALPRKATIKPMFAVSSTLRSLAQEDTLPPSLKRMEWKWRGKRN